MMRACIRALFSMIGLEQGPFSVPYTQSKLRLCSGNHRAGYFSNLACDWLSIVWAYSEQETENGPRSDRWYYHINSSRISAIGLKFHGMIHRTRMMTHITKCKEITLLPEIHDDIIKWKHFPRYWPFVQGIHQSPVNSPHKGQWRRALIFLWSASE